MAQQLADKRDIDFVIWEQLEGEKILENKKYGEFNRKTCDLILKEARNLALKELWPTMKDGDEIGVKLEKEGVKVPDSFHRPFELLKEGEWEGLAVPPIWRRSIMPGRESRAGTFPNRQTGLPRPWPSSATRM